MSSKQSARLKTKRKPGDPWISKNRVLNPSKAKRNCPIYRNPNFDTDETKLLIQLWGDPKVQRELITTHKKHLVIAQLATKMEEYGYYRSPEEITTRIKNMKCFYNRLKKEMESNKDMDPSWRHYADMDAIMTRPIFSVRPNEVPAPSLKYLMEQEEEKRKERKRKAEEEGIHVSDSDDDIEDVLAVSVARRDSRSKENNIVEPHAEIELEVDEETLAAIEKGGNQPKFTAPKENKNKTGQASDDELMIKMEIESEEYLTINEQDTSPNKSQDTQKSQRNDEELLVPKVEPIDVDDEEFQCERQNNSAPNLVRILNKPTSQSNTTGTSSSVSSVTPSKISVVSPTILMPTTGQATTAVINTQSPRQMHFSGNLQALLASSTARQTVTASNGMKFILVNAADHRGAQITTTTAAPLPTITQNNIMPQQNSNSIQQPQKSQQTVKTPPKNVQNNTARKRLLETSSPDRDTLRKRELSGIKSTLQKLLKAKEESNEMAAQRLALERERLQFERTIAEKFLGIFEQNQKIQQQLIQQQIQQNHHHQSHQRPTTTQQIFTTTTGNPATATAIQNQGQIMIPPKLLITTMVPTSVATSSAGSANTKVITTANIKNVTNTLTVEQPLLIPKEEPLD